jgi:hypothetical protein
MGDIARSGDLDVRVISDVTTQTVWGKGQQTMAESMPVVISMDQTSIPVTNTPSTPPDTTPVTISTFGNVATTAGTDTYYTIPNGVVLYVQYLSSGSQYSNGGSVTELFYDANGDLSVLTRIGTLWTDGENANESFEAVSYTGNGTRRIVLRSRGYTNNAREMYRSWRGYY